MNSGGGALVIRRILVAVDATVSSIYLLEEAANLAGELHAELGAIFVEDINLLRLAGLPFAREVAWLSASELHLDYQRMERVLRGRAAHARQTAIVVSTQLKVRCPLRIVRGRVAEELLLAAAEADLLILGKGGTMPGRRLGGVARRVALEAPCSVLLLKDAHHRRGPVMTTFSGHERDARVLSAAAQLARLEHGVLLVVIPAADEDAYRRRREEARALLGKGTPQAVYLPAARADPRLYQRLLREERVAAAALDGVAANAAALENALAALDCGILVVR